MIINNISSSINISNIGKLVFTISKKNKKTKVNF